MAQSTGGFWSSGFGQALSGIGAVLGLGPFMDQGINREVTANENDLSRLHAESMARLSQSNALQQMRLQQDFERQMSNTSYQRAIADMEAAGINPASLFGSSSSGASTPGASTPGSSASNGSVLSYGNGSNLAGSIMSSAFNAILAKDEQAADIAKAELVDNARHAHKMEEIREWKELKAANGSGSKWLDNFSKKSY